MKLAEKLAKEITPEDKIDEAGSKGDAKKVKDILDSVADMLVGKGSSISIEEIMEMDEDDMNALMNGMDDAVKDLDKLAKKFK
jgi:hypothetical protein